MLKKQHMKQIDTVFDKYLIVPHQESDPAVPAINRLCQTPAVLLLQTEEIIINL